MHAIFCFLLATLPLHEAFLPGHSNTGLMRTMRQQQQQRQQQQRVVVKLAEDDEVTAAEAGEAISEKEEIAEPEPEKEPAGQNINLANGKVVDGWTDPSVPSTQLSWWAYPLVIYPVTLIFDDIFHFLPKTDGTLVETLFGKGAGEIPLPGLF